MRTRSAGAQALSGGRQQTKRDGAVENAELRAILNERGSSDPKGQVC
jgi:hypothetical protein